MHPAYAAKVAQALLRLIVKVFKRRRLNCKIKRLKNIKFKGARKSFQLSTDPDYSDYVNIIIRYVWSLIFMFIYELILSPFKWLKEIFRGMKTESHISQVFNSKTPEYNLFKKTVLFAFGLAFSWLIFLFIEFQLDISRVNSIVLSVMILFVMTIGFPFYSQIQCVILLMLPSLFASNVRYIIVGYIFILIYTEAVPNIYYNVEIIVDSVACALDGTEKAGDSMLDVVRRVIQQIKQLIAEVKQKIDDAFETIIEYAKLIDNLLPNIGNACEGDNRENFEKCAKGNWFEKKGCEAKQALLDMVLDLCDQLEGAMDAGKKKLKEKYRETAEWVKEKIYFDIDMNHTLEYNYTKSKKYKHVARDMFTEFFEKHYYFRFFNFISYSNKVLLLLITFWVIINAIIYRNRYLSSDAYDNSYLNEMFFQFDRKRDSEGKETLIPLYVRESESFIDPWDFLMTAIEMRRLQLGLIIFFFSFAHVGLYIALSYLVWYIALFLRDLMQIIAQIFENPVFEVKNRDKSNMFGEMLQSMGRIFDKKFRHYIESCKPTPVMPDTELLKRILTFFAIILMSVFIQSYALRTRHYVCGLYYPHRIKERTLWLYHTILCRRGSFVEFTRKQFLKRTGQQEQQEEEDVSFLDYICGHYPFLRTPLHLCGLYGVYKFCNVCCKRGDIDDMELFKDCSNADCKGVYCLDCFAQINNLCNQCMRFIDFNFGDEFSEEYDSSDHENS